jgi:hypothetical protein
VLLTSLPDSDLLRLTMHQNSANRGASRPSANRLPNHRTAGGTETRGGALAVALAREKLFLSLPALIPPPSQRRELKKAIASVI